jgi:hypothetical protein
MKPEASDEDNQSEEGGCMTNYVPKRYNEKSNFNFDSKYSLHRQVASHEDKH